MKTEAGDLFLAIFSLLDYNGTTKAVGKGYLKNAPIYGDQGHNDELRF